MRKHPVAAFYALTFAVSWSGVFLVVGGSAGGAAVKAQDNPLFPLAVVAMLAGPSLAGLLWTALVDGGRGLRELLARLADWRVTVRWYAVALFTAPVLTIAIAFALSPWSAEFLPAVFVAENRAALVGLGLTVGLTAGFFEELGWTGFAVPRLTRDHGVLRTGLIMGLLWSGWHVPVVAWGIGDRAGAVPLSVFMIVDGLATLPAYRVLMVSVYDRTGSLFLAILMHASLTASALILAPQVKGAVLLSHGLIFAACLWIGAAIAERRRT